MSKSSFDSVVYALLIQEIENIQAGATTASTVSVTNSNFTEYLKDLSPLNVQAMLEAIDKFKEFKAGVYYLGNKDTLDSWKIEKEDTRITFSRHNGTSYIYITQIGNSIGTDSFYLMDASGRYYFLKKDGSHRTLLKPSCDLNGAVIGNTHGRLAFMSNGVNKIYEPNGGEINVPIQTNIEGALTTNFFKVIINTADNAELNSVYFKTEPILALDVFARVTLYDNDTDTLLAQSCPLVAYQHRSEYKLQGNEHTIKLEESTPVLKGRTLRFEVSLSMPVGVFGIGNTSQDVFIPYFEVLEQLLKEQTPATQEWAVANIGGGGAALIKDWNPGNGYVKDQVTRLWNGALYIAINDIPAGTNWDNSLWNPVKTSGVKFPQWDGTVQYEYGDVVTYEDCKIYMANGLAIGEWNPGAWVPVNDGSGGDLKVDAWKPNHVYRPGNMVTNATALDDFDLYMCISPGAWPEFQPYQWELVGGGGSGGDASSVNGVSVDDTKTGDADQDPYLWTNKKIVNEIMTTSNDLKQVATVGQNGMMSAGMVTKLDSIVFGNIIQYTGAEFQSAFTKSGIYRMFNSIGTLPSGVTSGNNDIFCQVFYSDTSWIIIRAYDVRSDLEWRLSKRNNVWGSWIVK